MPGNSITRHKRAQINIPHRLPARLALLSLAFWTYLLIPQWGLAKQETVWHRLDDKGAATLELYFFWSKTCPHCLRAKPFVDWMDSVYPWLTVHSFEVGEDADNRELFLGMARELKQPSSAVPAFMYCGQVHFGFSSDDTTGKYLREEVLACKDRLEAGGKAPEAAAEAPVVLPLIGEVNPGRFSLPVLTVILAGVDAFNPCAFFILLFLLSLLVHAQSRARMLLVGAIFILTSGVVYFAFMAAWLNVFMAFGEIRWVTLVAGMFAVLLAIINIKDYFLFRQGVTLSIPESAKAGLYQRVTGLIRAERMPTLIVGTLLLAIAANAYELLCTVGFPMLFTRVLTLNALPMGTYYLYLVFYNVIYVLPLLTIVGVFTLTLGSRKLSEAEGRLLKLLSGLMMLGLGLLLALAPERLDHLLTALALPLGAVGLTFLIHRLSRGRFGSRR